MTSLNLGCGSDIRLGYVNVDFRKGPGVDMVCDLSVFPWPFASGAYEEVLMLDFLEHFPYRDTKKILLECNRILGTAGELVVQVPDAEHVCAAFLGSGWYMCNRCGTEEYPHPGAQNVCPKCGQQHESLKEAAMMRLFGGQDYPGNFHHTMFDVHRLDDVVSSCGFSLVDWEEVEHQRANWNIKGRFRKRGSLWR